jgi:putative sigma-54 modulation protein
MQLNIKGKNLDVTEPLKDYVTDKIGRLDRYLPNIDEIRVELSVQKARSSQDRHVVQVTMRSNSTILRAEERNADIFAAIDTVRDKLQRQIKRFKEKRVRMRERARVVPPETPEELEETSPRIVRTKRFAVAPMHEEEAIEQMELLGHDFFVFFNVTTSSMNVVYRRRDGGYGLLQPELP